MTAPSMPEVYAQEGRGSHEVAPAVSGWGDEIALTSGKPHWLPDSMMVWPCSGDDLDGHSRLWSAPYAAQDIKFWDVLEAIRLPVPRYDFVYLALSKGYTPWFGGDAAPGDWDGGDVLVRENEVYRPIFKNLFDWDRRGGRRSRDIIGYTRKATSTALPLAHPAAPNLNSYIDGYEDALEVAAHPAAPQGEEAFTGHDRMDRPTMDEVWRKGGWGDACVANRTTVMRFIGTIDALEAQLAALAPAAIASGREGAE